jgi:hypothetical protein
VKRNKGLRLTKTKPIPDAYRFYAEVFGATERMRFPGPGGTLAHAEIQIVDSVVIVEDESPVRARMDDRDARGGRGAGGDGTPDGRAVRPGLACRTVAALKREACGT